MDTVEPHPLDYDWRFSVETVAGLVALAAPGDRCLCVGTPSIARRLHELGRSSVLVDRQPIQGLRALLRLDPSFDAPLPGPYDLVFIDPPWYPEVCRRWLGWAAAALSARGRIVCSLWPESTRPGADVEHRHLFHWIRRWADVEVAHAELAYEAPLFERIANAADVASREIQRFGDRLVLHRFGDVPVPPALTAHERWHRFVFDAHQLALREHQGDGHDARVLQHPLAQRWIWPSVSRRAEGRAAIDLWSSHNEVAVVEGSLALLQALRGVARGGRAAVYRFESEPGLRPLLEWHLASLKFDRTAEWTHLA